VTKIAACNLKVLRF